MLSLKILECACQAVLIPRNSSGNILCAMLKKLQLLNAYLLIFLTSSSVISAIPWSLEAQTIEDAFVAPAIERPSRRDQPSTEDRQSLDPAPPEDDGGGNGGGGGGGPRVVLFVSPPIRGEHQIVVPLRQDGEGLAGANILTFDETESYLIEDAAVIEQPANRSVGCLFILHGTVQPSFPMPIFFGEFLKEPVKQMNVVFCTTQLYDRHKDSLGRYTMIPVSRIMKEEFGDK